jgi:hypothetical protein
VPLTAITLAFFAQLSYNHKYNLVAKGISTLLSPFDPESSLSVLRSQNISFVLKIGMSNRTQQADWASLDFIVNDPDTLSF